jgi:hypothetical protein
MTIKSKQLAGLVFGLTTVVPALASCSASDTAEASREAAPERSRGTQSLVLDYRQEPPVIGAPVCAPASSCVVPFSLLGSATGDFEGRSAQTGGGARLADGSLYANSTLVFTGSIRGCGDGTVVMRSTGFNRGGEISGTIEIVEGSGTGDLAGLTGDGPVTSGEAGPDGSSGTVAMRIRCGP